MKTIISEYLGADDLIWIALKLSAIISIPVAAFSTTLESHGFNIWHGVYGALGQGIATAVAIYYQLKSGNKPERKYHPFVSIILFVLEVFFGFIVALFVTPWGQPKVNSIFSAAINQEVVLPEMAVAIFLGIVAPLVISTVRGWVPKKNEYKEEAESN